jgi:hypothetical protein
MFIKSILIIFNVFCLRYLQSCAPLHLVREHRTHFEFLVVFSRSLMHACAHPRGYNMCIHAYIHSHVKCMYRSIMCPCEYNSETPGCIKPGKNIDHLNSISVSSITPLGITCVMYTVVIYYLFKLYKHRCFDRMFGCCSFRCSVADGLTKAKCFTLPILFTLNLFWGIFAKQSLRVL